MDLAKFAELPPEPSGGAFLKFTPNDHIKIVRFLYEATPGVDAELGISCRRKLFDSATKKVIWDTPEGKMTMSLKIAVYSNKNEYSLASWDRSAVYGRDTLVPMFTSAGGRICDTVYKITASNAGTMEAVYNFFPLKDGDSYVMPSIGSDGIADDEEPMPTPPPAKAMQRAIPKPPPVASAVPPNKKKQFWEE